MNIKVYVHLRKDAYSLKVANNISKKVLFVAICRTLGIPARINEIDGVAEFYNENTFISVENKLQR